MLRQAASISLISRRVPRVMSCVSNTPGIAQNLNITIKKVMKETSELGKTSQMSLKDFYTLTRWFFRRIDVEVCCKGVMETLVSH